MAPDIAVIGGGVIGLSCAWRLAQHGARVTLYERLQTGREASWAAAGMLAPTCESLLHPPDAAAEGHTAFAAACHASRDLYLALAAELQEVSGIDIELSLQGAPGDWREPGIMLLAAEDDPQAAVVKNHGASASWPTGAASWIETDGQVESRKLMDALRAAALKAGVIIRENSTIRRCISEGERITALADENDTHPCGAVLLCAGAWTGKLCPTLPGVELPVRPLAGQMVVLRAEKRLRHVVYARQAYLVPRRDGRLLVGATMEDLGYCKRVTVNGVLTLLKHACALLPELAEVPLETQWCGLRPATPDGLPIIGSTAMENVWAATGHGRNGILLAPLTGQWIAGGMLEQQAVPEAFSPGRFPLSAPTPSP